MPVEVLPWDRDQEGMACLILWRVSLVLCKPFPVPNVLWNYSSIHVPQNIFPRVVVQKDVPPSLRDVRYSLLVLGNSEVILKAQDCCGVRKKWSLQWWRVSWFTETDTFPVSVSLYVLLKPLWEVMNWWLLSTRAGEVWACYTLPCRRLFGLVFCWDPEGQLPEELWSCGENDRLGLLWGLSFLWFFVLNKFTCS